MKKIISLLFIMFLIGTGCQNNNSKIIKKPIIIPTDHAILYHTLTCSHCIKVLNFMKQQKINQDKHIILKNPFKNKTDYNEYSQVIETCNIPLTQVGVPLLWDNGKCFRGDQAIINHWQNNTSTSKF